MNNNYEAYLEDFNLIKIITDSSFKLDNLFVKSSIEKFDLSILSIDLIDDLYHIYCKTDLDLDLNRDYYVSNGECNIFVRLGKVTRTIRFDKEFYTNIDLGVTVSGDKTFFRVWSPVAKQVKLVLDENEFNLKLESFGVWQISFDENLDGKSYLYKVRINEDFFYTLDPYATRYETNFTKCIVTDLNKIESSYFIKQDDYIIGEVSLRDLARSFNCYHISELNKDLIGSYYSSLRINTIQLMPVTGFGDVDEVNYKNSYNWGYNPVLPFAVSNYLTGSPKNGISDLISFIDTMHSYNISVTFDLVFNHVFDYKTFSYGLLVPGYFYYTDSCGYLTNASGCGNDFNSKSNMGRKYIIDCCKYLVSTFGIDGIRFDLMGLLDIETMNLLEEELKKINPHIFLYGEGWDIPNLLKSSEKPIISNSKSLKYLSFFNDYYRENIKKFCLGVDIDLEILKNVLMGSLNIFSDFRQSINYVECHDDYTFNDYLLINNSKMKEEEKKDRIKLSLCLNAICLGVPFYSQGEERCRTKGLKSNTYNAGDDANLVLPLDSIMNVEIVNTLSNILFVRSILDYSKIKDLSNLDDFMEIEKINNYILFTISNNDIDYYIYIKNNYCDEVIYINDDSRILFNECEICDGIIKFNKPCIVVISEIN